MSDAADPAATARGAKRAGPSGATAELEARLADLERRLERTSRGGGEQTAYWAILESILPSDARRHLRAAGREQLLAARSILDAWIARMDRSADEPPARRETIRVD
ncbi:MAG: hypothetical protein ABR509_02675 [Candidatus Limnocylindria bacterium]